MKVLTVEEQRGIQRKGKDLLPVKDGHGFLVRVELPDGRVAYMSGPGEPPVEPGDNLIVKR